MNKYILREKKSIILSVFFGLLSSVIIVFLGLKLGNIVDFASASDFANIKKYTMITVISTLILLIIFVLEKKFRQEYTMNVANNMRIDILDSLLKIPMREYKENEASYYFNIINSDIELIMDSYLDSLVEFLNALFGIIVTAAILFLFHPVILLVSIIASILPIIISNLFVKPFKKINNEKSEENEKYLSKMHETIYGLDVIKRSSRSDKFKAIFNNSVKVLGDKISRLEIFEFLVNKTMWSVNSLIQTLIIVVCSLLVLNGRLKSGAIISSIVLVTYFVESLTKASVNFTAIRSSKDISKRAINIIDKNSKQLEALNIKNNEEIDNIRFDKVSFSYGDKRIFEDLSLDIKHDNCVAVIGKSGSGKSTLINLLLKLESVSTGSIELNDRSLVDISEEQIYESMYLVPQDIFIFKCDLFDNISMFDERDELNIQKVKSLIDKLGIGYLWDRSEAHKDLANDALSGGEKKRVAIARALYQNSKVIIFDEPTSGLDPNQAQIINEIIFSLNDKMRIVITHNWDKGFLSRFDRVIDLKDFKSFTKEAV